MIMSHIAAPNSSYPASLEFVEAAFHRACKLFPSRVIRIGTTGYDRAP